MKKNKKTTSALVAAAFSGLLFAGATGCAANDSATGATEKAQNSCSGKNSCKGESGCNGKSSCEGKASCEGKSSCKSGNECKAGGSCKGV